MARLKNAQQSVVFSHHGASIVCSEAEVFAQTCQIKTLLSMKTHASAQPQTETNFTEVVRNFIEC